MNEEEISVRGPRRRAWFASILLWGSIALVSSTHQWTELRGTEKAMSWWRALGWQGGSWLLLAIVSPVLVAVISRSPLERAHPRRFTRHAVGSVVFGAFFLGIAVPVRLVFHPSGVRLNLFGEAYYKSAPQFIILGIVAYWAVVLVASLVETRARLGAALELIPEARDDQAPPLSQRLTLPTLSGTLCLRPSEIAWAEPSASGAVLHTSDGSPVVRQSLSRLESLLTAHGFVRCHRGCLVNVSMIREILGGASRDGEIVLESGERLPVSRRRRVELEAAITAPLSREAAPFAE